MVKEACELGFGEHTQAKGFKEFFEKKYRQIIIPSGICHIFKVLKSQPINYKKSFFKNLNEFLIESGVVNEHANFINPKKCQIISCVRRAWSKIINKMCVNCVKITVFGEKFTIVLVL